MVKQLQFKLMLLLCALVVGSGSVWADSYTYDFSSGGSYNSSITPVTNTWTTNYFTILQEKGTSNTAVGNYLTSPRWYQNHIITITPAAGYTITKIVINCGSSSYTGQDISASTGTVTKSGNNSTWSGSVTSSTPLVLTMGKQCRPSSLNVTYTVPAGAVAAPNFSPTSGAVAAGTEVTLSQTTADEIRYTTDGTDPTITTGTVYSGAIIINTPTTIKAIAIKDDAVSDVASASYTINVEKPIFDVEAGEVDQGTLLTISVAEGCSIIYTIDGSTPSYANSIGELYDSPIAINNAMVVKAIAVDNYENESAVTSATYVINYAGGIDITPNYTFFGKTAQFSGNTNDVVTGTKDGITVTYTRNGSSLYASSTAMRFYKDNTLKIDAPAGKTITNVVFTQSNGQRDDMTSTPDGYNSTTKTWTGDATSVTFTRPSAADSYLQFTNIEVVLANKVTIASACTDGEMYYGT